jgi:FPC/CPF motif-containing protein YcgG
MSANDKRKTLLERIVESLPDQLRQAYEAARGRVLKPTRY